jgi:hypothetical protein
MSLRTVDLRAPFSNQLKRRMGKMKNPDRNLDPGFFEMLPR